eukprot:3425449-Ditylum_brightwellii.AAC.1
MTGNNNNGNGLAESEQGKALEQSLDDDKDDDSEDDSDSVTEAESDDNGDVKSIHCKAKQMVKLTSKPKACNCKAAFCWTVVHQASVHPYSMD